MLKCFTELGVKNKARDLSRCSGCGQLQSVRPQTGSYSVKTHLYLSEQVEEKGRVTLLLSASRQLHVKQGISPLKSYELTHDLHDCVQLYSQSSTRVCCLTLSEFRAKSAR